MLFFIIICAASNGGGMEIIMKQTKKLLYLLIIIAVLAGCTRLNTSEIEMEDEVETSAKWSEEKLLKRQKKRASLMPEVMQEVETAQAEEDIPIVIEQDVIEEHDYYYLTEDYKILKSIYDEPVPYESNAIWKSRGDEEVVAIPRNIKYTMAKDEDFEWIESEHGFDNPAKGSHGYYKYIGNSKHVEIPWEINGVEIPVYDCMFDGSYVYVRAVKSTNPNVRSTFAMFRHLNTPTYLDITQLNMSGVTNASRMFDHAKPVIDLTGIDTSNVYTFEFAFDFTYSDRIIGLDTIDTSSAVYMTAMFMSSHMKELKLSNFDTSRVKYFQKMFYGSNCQYVDASSFTSENAEDIAMAFDTGIGNHYLIFDLSSFSLEKFSSEEARNAFTTDGTTYVKSQNEIEKLNSSWGNFKLKE